jgi:transcriptional regulator with XRE-family HTH domain
MTAASSFGVVLKQARGVRGLSAIDAARATGISAAYLSKLEGDAVKKPSPYVLHALGEALAVPYAELHAPSGLRRRELPRRCHRPAECSSPRPDCAAPLRGLRGSTSWPSPA